MVYIKWFLKGLTFNFLKILGHDNIIKRLHKTVFFKKKYHSLIWFLINTSNFEIKLVLFLKQMQSFEISITRTTETVLEKSRYKMFQTSLISLYILRHLMRKRYLSLIQFFHSYLICWDFIEYELGNQWIIKLKKVNLK